MPNPPSHKAALPIRRFASRKKAVVPIHRRPGARLVFGIGIALGCLLAAAALLLLFKSPLPGKAEADHRRPEIASVAIGEDNIIITSERDMSHVMAEKIVGSHPTRFRVRLLRVIDGDTIVVLWNGEDTGVRFQGINAPEPKEPGGPESTAFLRRLLDGAETVDLEFETDRPNRDSFGRLLAHVWRGDKLINLEMLRHGQASLYKKRDKGKYGETYRNAVTNNP